MNIRHDQSEHGFVSIGESASSAMATLLASLSDNLSSTLTTFYRGSSARRRVSRGGNEEFWTRRVKASRASRASRARQAELDNSIAFLSASPNASCEMHLAVAAAAPATEWRGGRNTPLDKNESGFVAIPKGRVKGAFD